MTPQGGHRKSTHPFLYNNITLALHLTTGDHEQSLRYSSHRLCVGCVDLDTTTDRFMIYSWSTSIVMGRHVYYIMLLSYCNDIIATGIARVTEIKVAVVSPTITTCPRNKYAFVCWLRSRIYFAEKKSKSKANRTGLFVLSGLVNINHIANYT